MTTHWPLWSEANWQVTVTPSHLTVDAPVEMEMLSSAPVGGGWFRGKRIVNRHVQKGYCHPRPVAETREWLGTQGMDPSATVALLTAARMEDAAVTEEAGEGFRLAAIVTAGVSNAARAGKAGPVYPLLTEPGTINTILIIDGQVDPCAMVNGVITATEAKTAVLQELDIRDGDGDVVTGTTTDAVVIAATQDPARGERHHYAGSASPLGRGIALAVHQALMRVLQRENRHGNR
ncbi:adenosylcobinamide amidohydrolase [Desmospora profundinema]|uniref:Adenosylcobinamide amidohydrolase n=1 Tax=Desmospora profundinema TaxID=1571184 RepID=A0ABU1IQT1_9BACL|nr:adenosylcobinamide amidohydrolase [Desmospora profundinema]MDR6226105.1 adenosylcobinamide amidohydrolase [Desmospora profundinema]